MLRLSEAYCCERVAGPWGARKETETLWKKAFGKRHWVSLTEVLGRYARHFRGDTTLSYDLIYRVLRDLPDLKMLDGYQEADYASSGALRAARALDRRWAKKIDAEWEGSLDYC